MKWRFIHIPKCAGTSIRRVYGQANFDCQPGHQPASCFGPKVFCWAVLRNPFDRAVSMCGHLYRGLNVKVTPALFRRWVRDGMPTKLVRHGETVVQAGYACDALKLKITDAQTNWITDSTHLIPYEYLEPALHVIVRQLGLDPQALPTIHASNRNRGFYPYYDDTSLITVHDRYAEDFRIHERLRDKFEAITQK